MLVLSVSVIIAVANILDKSILRKERLVLAYSLRVQSVLMSLSQWQESETPGHVASIRQQ